MTRLADRLFTFIARPHRRLLVQMGPGPSRVPHRHRRHPQRTAVALVAATLTASTAYAAGNHQICYEGPFYNSAPTFAVQCRSDLPGITCSISATASPSASYTPPAGASTVKTYQGQPGTTYTATIAFSDGTQRTCTTYLAGYFTSAGRAYATAPGATQAALTGYTTDQSGLVMTGVWYSRTTTPQRVQRNVVGVPKDFVLTGGGALGTNFPSGALISKMRPSGDLEKREWWVETQDATYPDPHNNETYAIGMKIEGIGPSGMRNLVAWTSGSSNTASQPSGQLMPPAGFEAILGGGAAAYSQTAFQLGQYLTASAPIPAVLGLCWRGACPDESGATGWTVASKDHLTSAVGWVTPFLSSMPPTIQIGATTYTVETYARGVTSPTAAHPGIAVSGRSGEFALTGVGARVNWQTFGGRGSVGSAGNLLWKVVPRPDLAGVEVSSKDHGISSPATITGYALGIKLVP
jgi:hypothetical protein